MADALPTLLVHVERAEGLARREFILSGDTYPFVKTYLDNKQNKQVSTICDRTLEPRFAFTARFKHVRIESTLYVKIYDKVVLGTDRFLGMAVIPLRNVYSPEVVGTFRPFVRMLTGRTNHNDTVSGRVYLQLCFVPAWHTGGEPQPQRSAFSSSMAASLPPAGTNDNLPPGWEARQDNRLRTYYVDHVNRRTQWEQPTAPATVAPQQPSLLTARMRSSTIGPSFSSGSGSGSRSPTVLPARNHSSVDSAPSSPNGVPSVTSGSNTMATPRRPQSSYAPVSPSMFTPVSPSTFTPVHSNPRDPMPPGWEVRMTRDGHLFFIDHNMRRSQWEDPRTGLIPPPVPPNTDPMTALAASATNTQTHPQPVTTPYNAVTVMPAAATGFTAPTAVVRRESQLGPLPYGWEQRYTLDGRAFFVDHINRRTQWEDPRYDSAQLAAIESQQRSQGIVAPRQTAVPSYIRDYQGKLTQFRAHPLLRQQQGKTEIRVRRANVFEDSFRVVLATPPLELKKRLWIKFEGEEGLDYGGLAREWFHLLSKEMFNPYYCLFEYSASDNYTLQISPNSGVNPDHLHYFRFIGRVAGMAVFHAKFLDAFFVPSFYKRMVGSEATLSDLQSVDPEKFQSLSWMLENDITDVLFETFTATEDRFGEKVTVELKPGGKDIEVTNDNKAEYVKLYVKWRAVRGTEAQMESFMTGFSELIPHDLLRVFDPKELEYLIGGLADIDVDDWEANTVYKNYAPSDKVVRWFWLTVRKFNSEQRCRLLQFATGTSRVPATGFKDLWGSDGPRKFCLEKWGTPVSLPRAHTCFNRVDLPPYDSIETLEAKLTLALEQSDGFNVE